LNNRRTPTTPDFGVWVKGKQGSKEGTFLAHGQVAIGVKVAGGLLSFGAMAVVWVDGEGLLPSVTFCLVQ
jgi:hypothetical protein